MRRRQLLFVLIAGMIPARVRAQQKAMGRTAVDFTVECEWLARVVSGHSPMLR
jgi:hypothetical protein